LCDVTFVSMVGPYPLRWTPGLQLRAYAADLAPERYTHTSGFARTAADAFTETPTVVLRQPGTILGLRARAVCRACNGGWMSGLEQRAKPILLDMMGAARPGSVITLGPEQAATVAAWAIKTAWMREETEPGDRVTTPQMRQALHRDVLRPECSKVWAARHAGRLDFDIKQAAIDAARHDRAWDTEDVRPRPVDLPHIPPDIPAGLHCRWMGCPRAARRPVPVGPAMAVRLGYHLPAGHRRQRPGCPDGRRAAAGPEVSPRHPVRA